MNITGSIEDHEHTFASSQWLILHHEAKVDRRTEFVRQLGIRSGAAILDVACGVGGWSSIFAKEVRESSIISFDRGLPVIAAAQNYCAEWVQSGRIRFFQADVEALPIREGVFDCAFLANCVSYFDDAERALGNVYRALKPCGRMIVRNFDDGLVSVFPCDPELNLKVLWGAAREARKEADPKSIDPFEGRQIADAVRRYIGEPIRSFTDTTLFKWPFSAAQCVYIAKNIEWYGRRARPSISQSEFDLWMSLIEPGHPNSIFNNRASTYCMIDFCAEIVKPGAGE